MCAHHTPLQDNWEGKADPLANKRIVERAYEEVMLPYNGWLTRNSFALATRAVPAGFPMLAPTEDKLREDLEEWVTRVGELLERMRSILIELDLEDQRKSL